MHVYFRSNSWLKKEYAMPRPDRAPDPHPVPRQRLVLVSALDLRYNKNSLTTLLAARGIDVTAPYREESTPEGTLYTQDIPADAL